MSKSLTDACSAPTSASGTNGAAESRMWKEEHLVLYLARRVETSELVQRTLYSDPRWAQSALCMQKQPRCECDHNT